MRDLIGESTGGLQIHGDIAKKRLRAIKSNLEDPADPAAARLHRYAADETRGRTARARILQREVNALVQRRYQWRGYQTRSQAGAAPDVNLYTFAAFSAGELMGTMCLRLDSDRGLRADGLYGIEVGSLREGGNTVCEFTQLALDENVASMEILAALFHTAYLYAHVIRGCSHVVIEVNPRHVAFYRRVLQFQRLGQLRHHPQVDAPAVLLVLEFARITQKLEEFFSQPDWPDHTRSFYFHGFSPNEASAVVCRLRKLEEERQCHALTP